MGTKALAVLGLLLTTVIWGSTFVVMKNTVDLVPPAWLLAFRFTAATIAMAFVFRNAIGRTDKRTVGRGAILGVFLAGAYLLQTYGLKYTTASKNAFITTLYIVLVPFLQWAVYKKRPGCNVMAAAFLATVGLALLSLRGDLTVELGDMLTFLCGICFALHILCVDRFTERFDPVVLTVVQIGTAALICWVLAPFLDGRFDVSVLANAGLLGGLIYLSLFATMGGFLLQNVGQKYLSATTTSLLLSLESVFGAVFSVVFLKEVMTGRMIAGCGLLFLAVILSECWPGNKKGEP